MKWHPRWVLASAFRTDIWNRMLVLKAFKYRLYPTPSQEALFTKTAGCRRLLWNLALEQRCQWNCCKKSLDYHDQAAELGALKSELPWFKDVPHHCLQQTLVDLDRAFKRFVAKLGGYPSRKRKWQSDSFRFPDPKQFSIRRQTRARSVRLNPLACRFLQVFLSDRRSDRVLGVDEVSQANHAALAQHHVGVPLVEPIVFRHPAD